MKYIIILLRKEVKLLFTPGLCTALHGHRMNSSDVKTNLTGYAGMAQERQRRCVSLMTWKRMGRVEKGPMAFFNPHLCRQAAQMESTKPQRTRHERGSYE